MTGSKRKYKANKVRSFLFFLLLALVFWVLTKFSEESVATIYGSISYTNLPETASISTLNAKDIAFDMTGNGFQFLRYNLNPPNIEINLSKYYKEGDSLVNISGSEVNKIIASQLDTKVGNLSVDNLRVQLDVIVTRKVPVQFISELTYKEGFRQVGTPLLQPDSIIVSGPSEAIAEITAISTKSLLLENVSEPIETVLALELPENMNLSFSKETIQLKLSVEEFTQKELSIPVEVINVPIDMTIKLLPENITLTFDVSVSQFNNITPNDFKIVCDYQTNTSEDNILVPKLTEIPDGLHHIEWSTKKIEYLIFK